MENTPLLCLQSVTHAYRTGASIQSVLHDVSLSIPSGQSCAIVGASGSGKSTLLNNQPSAGRLLLNGREVTVHRVYNDRVLCDISFFS
ncbi:hypothetical protein DDT52_19140 [Brenneria roseae subsp. roseae]|uniref:ATP-binding cassette domain-containing protein n=1 Tax=Brenneria roseae TaxID=1509241 RepID=UPI000D60C59A|nr:hypothetical protein DDT52_19140 [Brenneria roseae subsp. roseae]